MAGRKDERTVREKLGNAAWACSDNVAGVEQIKSKGVTTNAGSLASVVRNQQRREKTNRNGVQERTTQRKN